MKSALIRIFGMYTRQGNKYSLHYKQRTTGTLA